MRTVVDLSQYKYDLLAELNGVRWITVLGTLVGTLCLWNGFNPQMKRGLP